EIAASAMLRVLEELPLRGRVVLGPWGEGVLSHGSLVGSGSGPEVDLGVYPVEGASLVARGLPWAFSMLVAVPSGSFPVLPAVAYADKIAVGPLARGAVDLDDSLADNLRRIAFARDARVQDLVVAVLDRPRHREMLDEVRATGARILNLEEGDIAAALMTATDGTGVDAMMGIGGVQEAVMAACGLRCLGGDLVGSGREPRHLEQPAHNAAGVLDSLRRRPAPADRARRRPVGPAGLGPGLRPDPTGRPLLRQGRRRAGGRVLGRRDRPGRRPGR